MEPTRTRSFLGECFVLWGKVMLANLLVWAAVLIVFFGLAACGAMMNQMLMGAQ